MQLGLHNLVSPKHLCLDFWEEDLGKLQVSKLGFEPSIFLHPVG